MATELEVDVARVGTFRGMSGPTVDLTRQVLEDLVTSLDLAAFRPKIWAGHSSELRTDTPALGDVVGLRTAGDRLMANLRLTPAGHQRMKDGAYSERSIEMDFRDGKARFLGLALLGAHPPAIKGLTPLFMATPAAERPGMILLAAGSEAEEESPDEEVLLAAADPQAADFYRRARALERQEHISFAEAVNRVSREESGSRDDSETVPPGADPISFAAAQEAEKRSRSAGISFAAALDQLYDENNAAVIRYVDNF